MLDYLAFSRIRRINELTENIAQVHCVRHNELCTEIWMSLRKCMAVAIDTMMIANSDGSE